MVAQKTVYLSDGKGRKMSLISRIICNFAAAMRFRLFIIIAAAVAGVSCSRTGEQARVLSAAEEIVETSPDSALALIDDIEPADINADSLRALYYLVTASAHKATDSSMASDSLVRLSADYYKGRDKRRYVQSANLYALHRFWAGDVEGALDLLDSMTALTDIPDSLMIVLLQSRIGVGGSGFDCERNIGYINRLMELDTNLANQLEYKYQLCENYQFAGRREEALAQIDELIAYAGRHKLESEAYQYTYEKIGILEELGRYSESLALADSFISDAHGDAIPYLHFWKALNYFNMGDFARSAHELSIADSCAAGNGAVDADYYNSFAVPLRAFLDYRANGSIKLIQLAQVNNSRHEEAYRTGQIRQETERNALRLDNQRLSLRVESQRKTAIIIIVALVAIIICLIAVRNIQKRKRQIIDAEERAETLQKMVDEMKMPTAETSGQEALRRAMLQQLGIIRMVAETPTEQNREMLRKISSIGNDTKGALVNWANVYDIVDNLYSAAYTRIHERYGDILSEKEEQIIALMLAGFSTKEISVVTAQTAATIYVRKSSIRKKLGVAEKEDIAAFLRHELSL